MNENNFISDKVKKYVIFSSLGCAPLVFIGIALFVAVFSVLGLFDSDDSNTGSFANNSSECGFTFRTTSLSKEEYIQKLTNYAKEDSRAKDFADNAGDIYDLCLAANINPELAIVRAAVEGYSPHVNTNNGSNNYWGIGCYNGADVSSCKSYDSIEEGVNDFTTVLNQWDSLKEMMNSYAYIGKYWYNPGSSSLGGCHYAKYIYPDGMPPRVAKACKEGATCNGSSCVKTTSADQEAYAKYQINKMAEVRESIFGLKNDEGVECSSNDVVIGADVNKLIKMSQAEAWEVLIGKKTSDWNPYIDESSIEKRITKISVPIRTWDSKKSGHNPRTDTLKKEIKIEVNSAMTELWKSFFTDVYNNAPDFVIVYVGCYEYRTVSGQSGLSAHAYGVACDINGGTFGNWYGQRPYSESLWKSLPNTRSKYQIVYKGSKILEIAHKYTLINGNDWPSPDDAMHFSFIRDMNRQFAQACQGKVTCS